MGEIPFVQVNFLFSKLSGLWALLGREDSFVNAASFETDTLIVFVRWSQKICIVVSF